MIRFGKVYFVAGKVFAAQEGKKRVEVRLVLAIRINNNY
jgi:hypothetical protein